MRRRPAARSCSTGPATPSCGRRTGRSPRPSTGWPARPTRPDLRADLGPGGGELQRLLPGPRGPRRRAARARRRRPGHRAPPAPHGRRRAPDRDGPAPPVLLVLEDGHWADHPTLLLLRHLGRAAADARLLVVATFRDTEADLPQELGDALVDLRRNEQVARLRLAGLSVGRRRGVRPPGRRGQPSRACPALAESIFELTGGNAFLAHRGVARARRDRAPPAPGADLAGSLAALDTPDGVRDVVSQRLATARAGDAGRARAGRRSPGPEFETDVIREAGPASTPRRWPRRSTRPSRAA